jgi:hypothetical protein
MSQVTVYSSAPETTQLACAFQNVRRAGHALVVRPLSARPAPSLTRKQRLRLQDERHAVCQTLANIGLKLDLFETGQLRPDVGEEPGLRAERDSLQARLRGLEAALRDQAAGVAGATSASSAQ